MRAPPTIEERRPRPAGDRSSGSPNQHPQNSDRRGAGLERRRKCCDRELRPTVDAAPSWRRGRVGAEAEGVAATSADAATERGRLRQKQVATKSAAIALAKQGLPVFPVVVVGPKRRKLPTCRWRDEATSDPDAVAKLFDGHPGTHIGVPMGVSGLFYATGDSHWRVIRSARLKRSVHMAPNSSLSSRPIQNQLLRRLPPKHVLVTSVKLLRADHLNTIFRGSDYALRSKVGHGTADCFYG